MTILQKISTGGFDQQIVDEIKTQFCGGERNLTMLLCERIEDTLDYEDLKDERDNLATARDTLEDEITGWETKYDDLEIARDSMQNDCNKAMREAEDLEKIIIALKADAARAKAYAKGVIESFGFHKVT